MNTNITTISGISSKLGNMVRTVRSKTVLAAAVAATTLAVGSTSFGAISDITSLTAKFTTGVTTSPGSTNAVGTSNVSMFFPDSKTYTMNYANDVDQVLSVVAGGTTYNVTGTSTAVVRRSTGATNDTIWEAGTNTSNTVNLEGSAVSGYNQALSENNLLVGADNVFSNMGNSVGDNTNVVRVDLLTGPLTAAATKAFSVFDRGPTTDHDSFKIAAITAVDSSGNPTNYGPLISFSDGTWGKTDLVSAQQEIILRKNDSVAGDPLHPADSTGQAIGGVLIPTSNLVAAGTTIYGYSLFSADANGSGTQLVNWTNSTFFPSADSTSTGGGLDPVAVLGNVYTSSVPEPTSATLLTLAVGGLLTRRSKRKQA